MGTLDAWMPLTRLFIPTKTDREGQRYRASNLALSCVVRLGADIQGRKR